MCCFSQIKQNQGLLVALSLTIAVLRAIRVTVEGMTGIENCLDRMLPSFHVNLSSI
jgi:hypothetical protein